MERKYYLRGLGIGIAVTAIIMGIALSGDKTMTNDEIIARAKELGMVENTVLSDTESEDTDREEVSDDHADEPDETDVSVQPQNDPESMQEDSGEKDDTVTDNETDIETDTETGIDEEEQENQAEDDGDEETDPSDLLTADDSETGDVSDTAEDTETADDIREDVGGTVTSAAVKVITINSGDGSYTVAKKLENVGVVTSAQTFDTFLCQNGYDKILRTGTFSIPADASDEQIARIVTGRE